MKIITTKIGNIDLAERALVYSQEEGNRLISTFPISNEKKLKLGQTDRMTDFIKDKENVNISDLTLVPLYKNCLIDKKMNESDMDNDMIINVQSENNIATVKLNKAALITPIIQDEDINKGVHEFVFGAVTLADDWSIVVYTTNKEKLLINKDGIKITDVNFIIKEKKNNLKAQKLLILPKKVFVVKDYKKERKEGYISIAAKDIANNFTSISSNLLEEIVFASTVSKQEKETIRKMFPKACK